MNGTGGALDFDVILNDGNFQKKLRAITAETVQFGKTTVNELTTVENTFRRLGQLGAGYLAFNSLGQLPVQIAKVRGEFQQLEVAFETMLGSKSKADKLMAQTVQLAASTPFDLKGVASGAKQLLAYGVANDQVIGTLRKLGDISSGLSLPLERLTYLYGTTKTQGRLFAADLNQFVGSGIPLIKLLADQFGVAEDKVKGLVEEGKVGFPEVQKAIDTLTTSGGMFAGLMEKQSQTITGLMSNFSDALDQMFNDLGRSSEGTISTIIKGGIDIVSNYEDVIDILKVLVTTYGAYKATVIATAAIQNASAAAGGIKAWFELARGIKTAKEAQAAFSLATSASPIGAVIALVAALTTAWAVYGSELSEAEKAQDDMNESMEQMDKDLNKEIAHIGVLREQITGENLTRDEKAKKLKELIALNPELLNGISLENAATGQSTRAINEYIRAKKEQLRVSSIQAQIDANLNKISDITAGRSDDQFRVNPLAKSGLMQAQAASGGSFDAAKLIEKDIKAQKEAAVKGLQDLNRSYMEQVNNGIEQRRAGRRKELQTEKEDVKKTIDYYDEQIEALNKKKKAESTSLSDTIKFNKQIEDLENKKSAITGEITKEQEKAQKEADKVGPMGSLSYWNNIATKAQEIIDKTTDSKTIQQQSKIKFDAEQKAEEIRKLYALKSFDEELEEKRKAYALYSKWVEMYGKESADTQFKQLVSSNADYIDYLSSEIQKLESLKNQTPLNEKDSNNLIRLNAEKTEASGGKSVVEQFTEELSEAKKEAGSLTEYLEYLKIAQEALDSTVNTTSLTSQKKVLADSKVAVQNELKENLKTFLADAGTYAQKRIDVEKKYNELRKTAIKESDGEELSDTFKAIEEKKKAELEAISDEEFEKSDSFKRIHQEYLSYGRKEIKERIENIQKALAQERISAEERKKLEFGLAAVKRQLETNTVESIKGAATLLDQVLGDVNLSISKTFSIAMKDISGALNNVSTLMDSEASTMDQVGSIIGLVSFVAVTVRDAFMKQEDLITGMENQTSYYEDLANQIEGINLLLERQARIVDGLKGGEKIAGSFNLIGEYAKQQEMALQGLMDMSVDVISKQTEVFVDPILGTEMKNKGFTGVWTQLMTGGKAKTKIKYEFENVDTKGFDDIEDFIGLLAEIKKGGGKLNGKDVVQADIEALELYIKTYQDAEAAQAQLLEDFKKFLTATTEEQIVDSLVEGFRTGKNAAADFADNFGQMMQNALINSLKAQMMDEDMAAFYKKFSDYSLSDNILTKEEIAELQADYNKLIEEGKKRYDNMQQITGIDLSSQANGGKTPLSGVITGASEETTSMLNGSINAMRISQAEATMTMRQMLLVQFEIRTNTGQTAANTQYLISMAATQKDVLAQLKRMESNDSLRAKGIFSDGG